MESINLFWVQLWPSKPTLTAATLPSQTGRVIIVTGSTSGLGLALVQALYKAEATVFMAARRESKAKAAIETITTTTSTATPGKLPGDPATLPIQHTAQNLEPQLSINCVGPYLLTQLLAPILVSTAQSPSTPPNSVRVIWTSSMLVDAWAPPEGIRPSDLDPPSANVNHSYALSKTGNWFLAVRLAKQLGGQGVVSITQNPGNLSTPIWDHAKRWIVWVTRPLYYPVDKGVCTLLWAGMSENVTVQDGGGYAIPWGRWHPYPRKDLLEAIKDEEGQGDNRGRGYAKAFEEWYDKVSREFR
ncbi:hypothetical protein BDV06DRAFT_211445 [Aspergillus oleicola]